MTIPPVKGGIQSVKKPSFYWTFSTDCQDQSHYYDWSCFYMGIIIDPGCVFFNDIFQSCFFLKSDGETPVFSLNCRIKCVAF